MNMIESVKTCLRKYADFNGRASRSEFWWFYLATILGSLVLALLMLSTGDFYRTSFGFGFYSVIHILYSLAIFLPQLAVGARRLHDINRSGWWQLVIFAPLIGWIVLLVFFVTPPDEGGNEYGKKTFGLVAIFLINTL